LATARSTGCKQLGQSAAIVPDGISVVGSAVPAPTSFPSTSKILYETSPGNPPPSTNTVVTSAVEFTGIPRIP